MEIKIRRIHKDYLDVYVEHFGNKIEIGVLNKEESKNLAMTLESAADDLNSGWPYEETE